MKIIYQRSKCIGCGSCVAACDKFFKMEDDGLTTLKGSRQIGEDFELEVENADCAKEAAEVCPVQIIKIEE